MDNSGNEHEYSNFIRAIGQKSNEKHQISQIIEAAKWQDHIFKCLRTRYKDSLSSEELYNRFLVEIEPRVTELQMLSNKTSWKAYLMEVINSFERDNCRQIDILIGRMKLTVACKYFAESLPSEPDELYKKCPEVGRKILESDKKIEIVKSLLNVIRKGNFNEDIFNEKINKGTCQIEETNSLEKFLGNNFKRQNKLQKVSEFEMWLEEFAKNESMPIELAFNEPHTSGVIYLKRPDLGQYLKIAVHVTQEKINIESAPDEQLKESLEMLISPSQDIKSNFLDIMVGWKKYRNK